MSHHPWQAPSDVTTPLDVPQRSVQRASASQRALAVVAVAAAGFLVGVAAATAIKPPSTGAELVAADIDPAGGTVRFEDGQLVFPAGAVSRKLRVVVRRSPISDRLRITGKDPVVVEPGELFAYSFEPSDASFTKPVELTFRLPPGSRNGSVFARRDNEIVTLSGTVDPLRATATIRIRDFRFADLDGDA